MAHDLFNLDEGRVPAKGEAAFESLLAVWPAAAPAEVRLRSSDLTLETDTNLPISIKVAIHGECPRWASVARSISLKAIPIPLLVCVLRSELQ